MDLVDRLLDLDVECSQADKNLWTPLTYAAAGGHASCVRALLALARCPSPGKGMVTHSGRPKCVHAQLLEFKGLLDVICCEQRQCTAQAVTCIRLPCFA